MNWQNTNGARWPEEVRQKVEHVYEPVVQWIRNRLNMDIEEAREAVHEILKRLHNGQASRITTWDHYLTKAAIRQHRRSKGKPKGKLKILLFSELSKEERKQLYAIPAPGPNPADLAVERELLAFMRDEIQKLPKRQREVLTLEIEGLTPEEIRVRLGLKKVSTVWSNRCKAVAKLGKNPKFREAE